MVTIKNPVRRVIMPLALGSLMIIPGCKKDEPVVPTKTDLLIGDWKVTEIDGQDFSADNMLFKFKSSGDWQFCYSASASSCSDGEWKWQDSSETAIVMTAAALYDFEWKIDVVVLDETRLEGTWTQNVAGSVYTELGSVKMIKVI